MRQHTQVFVVVKRNSIRVHVRDQYSMLLQGAHVRETKAYNTSKCAMIVFGLAFSTVELLFHA